MRPIYANTLASGDNKFPTSEKSGTPIVLTGSDTQKVISVTTGASDSILTLPTSAIEGVFIYVQKADSGAGKVVINTSLAYLMTINDIILLRWSGSAWEVVDHEIQPVVDIFISSGTWDKRPLLTEINVMAIGAGSGGASGRRGAVASIRGGGAGAQGGNYSERIISTAILSSTHTITIATGTAGGAAVSANSTNGNASPALAGTSTFGSLLSVGGSARGAAGSAGLASGGPSSGTGFILGSAGGNGSTSSGGQGGNGGMSGLGGGGGAGGAGITAANADSAGGTGGNGGSAIVSTSTGGAGGAIGTNPGSNGTSQSITFPNGFCGGGGGGGGGANAAGAGGAGGNGGFPGGGGAGGGPGVDALGNSGAGGTGADGCIYVINYFK